MKILVTGGAGFIGSHLVDAFIAKGHKVVVVDNLSTGRASNLNPAAKFYKVDIAGKGLNDIFKREKPDIVDHHAAQISVSLSVKQPAFDARANILGLLNVRDCSLKFGVKKIIFASSGGCVYGEPDKLPVAESAPLSPASPYGISKTAGEHYLRFYYKEYGLKYTALRYANVYGPRQDPYGEAGVVAIFCGKIIKGERPTIFGDG